MTRNEEMIKNKSTMNRRHTRKDGYTAIFEVDISRVTWDGMPWSALSRWQKRKFENFLVLTEPNELVKVLYV